VKEQDECGLVRTIGKSPTSLAFELNNTVAITPAESVNRVGLALATSKWIIDPHIIIFPSWCAVAPLYYRRSSPTQLRMI
jgi:hypothetical protein